MVGELEGLSDGAKLMLCLCIRSLSALEIVGKREGTAVGLNEGLKVFPLSLISSACTAETVGTADGGNVRPVFFIFSNSFWLAVGVAVGAKVSS
jgi:hypothetical protein